MRARSQNTRKIREKYEKNTRARGKTRGRGPPVSFFLELSYFSRIFAGAGPQPKYEKKNRKNTGKIRENYESSRKNERARAARLVFPRALVFFSYFCWGRARSKNTRKIRDKYGKKYEKNTRARGKTRGRGPPVSFFLGLSYFSCIFLVFFSYCPLLLDCLSYFLSYSLSYFSRILFVF